MRVVALAVSLAGCATSTSDVYVYYNVLARGELLTMSAFMYDGNDEEADVGVARIVMSFRGQEYTASKYRTVEIEIDGLVEQDEPVEITFERDGEVVSSTASMPQPPQLEPIPVFVSRSEDFVLSWAPAPDQMAWTIDTWSTPREYIRSCIVAQGEIPAGAANVTIPADTLGQDVGGICTAVLSVARYRSGPVSPSFAGGDIYTGAVTAVPFASTP